MKVLVVEDNPDLAANLVDFLTARGHLVDAAGDGVTGLLLAGSRDFDVILLDIILPGLDGLTLCRRLREESGNATPILMLTARDTLDDKVAGLEAGADDYLVKPFALREVAARIQALARRAHASVVPGPLQVADLSFDPATLRITRAGRDIALPPIARRMLEALMRAAPRVLGRREMERAIWGDAPPDSDALRSHMHSLRAAIDKPFGRPLLRTMRGVGWQIAAPEEPAAVARDVPPP
ncbi:MAG: response regulator transcription factor [Gammaproteobacteria bacterium]|nr:response regulator transcription factor [Gammaproteobacteria bacterium]MBU1646004.1 response regulator transcription factor [Gammaproteobacteria bacterium]MBU1972066.1 response regulator transcription factor [Gammaproteobacteria bacterium]